MDLLLLLIYGGICTAIFKIFRIPLNKWTVPTAILGGVVLVGALVFLMNYNHPYAKHAKEFFVSVPIVPDVSGTVIAVEVEPNTPLQQGDVLFRIDPKPYELAVERLRAQLAEARQDVAQNRAAVNSAEARVAAAKADRDRAKQAFERYEKGARRGGGQVFSEVDIENRRQLYLGAEAAVNVAAADLERARLEYESQVDGVDTRVARFEADLKAAEYDLERTVVRAPSAGFATQVALRPGMRAVTLPLRPAMVFIPEQERLLVGMFWQNSLLRMREGFEVEVSLDSVPGHIFKGRVRQILPAMSEGDLQSSGNLVSANRVAAHGFALATVELTDESLDDYQLPHGVQGKMAIFSDRLTHVAVMRKILLRMVGWLNYVFPVK